MKKRLIVSALVAAMSFGLVLGGAATVFAKATGPCSDCHTMHDSQGGSSDLGDTNAQSKLLLYGTCVSCHTGTNTDTAGVLDNSIPYVYDDTAVDYGTANTGTDGNTLAGGNFYWVTTGDQYGHNVQGVAAAIDTTLTTPPGFNNAFNQNGAIAAGSWATTDWLTCAGTNGCHGTHNDGAEVTDQFVAVAGGHHGDDSTIDGTSVATSYRFLLGIVGLEDSDWEYQPIASAHNQYKAVDRTADTTAAANANASTISYLCAECHGDFHSGAANLGTTQADGVGSPWIRHPTDFDLENASTSEYDAYNGGTGLNNAYSVVAPVGSADVSSVLSVVTPGGAPADDAIVTCISCHRAHGTPYADLLRWDPDTAEAGTADTGGCLICHTTK